MATMSLCHLRTDPLKKKKEQSHKYFIFAIYNIKINPKFPAYEHKI